MQDDTELLNEVPNFITMAVALKARPQQEGDHRFIYLEASNEDRDHDGEVILQKALSQSADFYLKHGNIDISHYTIMGPGAGIPNFMEYEIGQPREIRVDGKQTFLKAELYKGDSAMARNANMVWDSLTKQDPPARWYPSIGGSVLHKSVKIDPLSKKRTAVVSSVRWNNTALDRCPVNKTVATASTAPVGVFAKAMGGFILKGLEAGGGTDSAALVGGAALRKQSLEGKVLSYWDFRERLAKDLRAKNVGQKAGDLVAHAVKVYQSSPAVASEWVARFMGDLSHSLKHRSHA